MKYFKRKAWLSACNISTASEVVSVEFNITLFCCVGLLSIYFMRQNIKINFETSHVDLRYFVSRM